ncbi:tRNA preQ1(34) S-adenosylmethionine ribosyltransferase-isomerase QueA [Candidatus Fermentibacteria bacterium]|nr:tRNA preQ1(34) S-adenosylmethionine ribosyltransferase-isomerase QueA [Candidatus Fermentibacteria bacterium]
MAETRRDETVRRSDLYFDLPPELIAQWPSEDRTGSRLMIASRSERSIRSDRFADLPDYLTSGDLMVMNDSRVFPARLFGARADTGGKAEVLLLERKREDLWRALVRPGKRCRKGISLEFEEGGLSAEILESLGRGRAFLRFAAPSGRVTESIERHGSVPLPPYIKREAVDLDRSRYQTVYATRSGAVAAPTAGLHFDEAMLDDLRAMSVELCFVTLHVGPGTFEPLRREELGENKLEPERFEVRGEELRKIARAKSEGRRIIAVGTTSTRVLETIEEDLLQAYLHAGRGREGVSGHTDLFIFPPYRFRNTDMLLTNFHLPESSLLSLLAAFMGLDFMKHAYAKAIEDRFRFYSYGDAMLVI